MALPAPIAYWPFDEATGTTAADASGNGHTATLYGLGGSWDTSALKKFGAAALACSGINQAATFTAIPLSTAHTVAFWMNGWDGSNDGVLFGWLGDYYACYVNSTDFYYSAGTGNYVLRSHGGGLTGSHHVVITRSGTTVTWYKDGTSLGSQTLGSNTALELDKIAAAFGNTIPFAGTLDDVRFYNVALSGAEVAELYALVPSAAVATAESYVWGPL